MVRNVVIRRRETIVNGMVVLEGAAAVKGGYQVSRKCDLKVGVVDRKHMGSVDWG